MNDLLSSPTTPTKGIISDYYKRLISPKDQFCRRLLFKDKEEVESPLNKCRFIPSRAASNLEATFSLVHQHDPECESPVKPPNDYNDLLQSEVLGITSDNLVGHYYQSPSASPCKLFRYDTPMKTKTSIIQPTPIKSVPHEQRLLNTAPYKVLAAPNLSDDFYLNVLDWSSTNLVGVGLHNSVYIYNANNGKVSLLNRFDNDSVASICWHKDGRIILEGTTKGCLKIFDATQKKLVREFKKSGQRIGSIHWNDNLIANGGKHNHIYIRDLRSRKDYEFKMRGHSDEICGLKWNFNGKQLATGANNNVLSIWEPNISHSPLYTFTEHSAAVKAIAWSPHQNGLLASGGGTDDKKIKFWNMLNGELMQTVDTESQICNLLWSPHRCELVSTHGFTLNQINVWKYSQMTKLGTFFGHTSRVIYLGLSPDGQNIVTGAGDETLRFWNAFPADKNHERTSKKLSFFGRRDMR